MKIQEINNSSYQIIEVINHLLPQLTEHFHPITLEQLEVMIKDENVHLFFIYNEKENVVGMATLARYFSPTGYKAWIEDVVIDVNYRQHGYGKAIISHIIKYAQKEKNWTLNLTSRPSRKAANYLYQSLGFEKRETNVYKLTSQTISSH